jgi:hypothetical protein
MNGAEGTSDMDGKAARAAASESGEERVQISRRLRKRIRMGDVSTSLDMTR